MRFQAGNQNSFLALSILYEGTNDKTRNQLQVHNQSKISIFLFYSSHCENCFHNRTKRKTSQTLQRF